MTVTVNNQSVSKTVISHAVQRAIRDGITVVIYGTEIADTTRHLVATAAQWEACINKDELKFVTKIDKDGNFID